MTPRDVRVQDACLSTLLVYKKTTASSLRRILRNQLYELLQDKLELWVRATIKNLTKEEIKSLTWDSLNHAVKYWKPGNKNLYQHFKRYTSYTVLNSIKETRSINLESIQDLANILTENKSPERTVVNLIALKDLRKSLKGRNRESLDDLIMGNEWDRTKGQKNAYYARRDLIKEILISLLN